MSGAGSAARTPFPAAAGRKIYEGDVHYATL